MGVIARHPGRTDRQTHSVATYRCDLWKNVISSGSERLHQHDHREWEGGHDDRGIPQQSPSIHEPGEGLRVRSLCLEDYDRGFLELLGQLTSVGNISREEWDARFEAMKSCKDTYYVVVIEDIALARVIGAATLVVEKKFIHSCGLVGRLEDVVVSDVYRGKQLGKLVVATTSLLATKLGCYKITLNCNDKMIKFYNAMGYKSEDGNANYMCIRVQGKPREPQA